jgi:parallel beta-helix repeat protein
MKIFFCVLAIIGIVTQTYAQPKYEPGIILIKVQNVQNTLLEKNQVIAGSEELKAVFQQFGAIDSYKFKDAGPRLQYWYRLEFPKDAPLDTINTALKLCSDIELATLNYYGVLAGDPNDLWWSDQWVLQQINMPDAWDITTGSSNILVGILDTGLDYLHYDLKDNIWVNPGEDIDSDDFVGDFGPLENGGDENNITDDGNSYIDDLMGWNFIDNSNELLEDGLDHGTRVAGVIGAKPFNTIGLAGISGGWGTKNGARLIGLKIAEPIHGQWDQSRAADALTYLRFLSLGGNTVIANMSFQSHGPDEPMQLLYAAVLDARDAGVVMVAASGNVRSKGDYTYPNQQALPLPARYSSVLAIGASILDGEGLEDESRWDESIYDIGEGEQLLIVAPTRNIQEEIDIVTTRKDQDYYSSFIATSAACPVAVGVIALMLSVNPDLSYTDISDILANTADKIGPYQYTGTPSRSYEVGHGRLNAYKALKYTLENYGGTIGGEGDTVTFHDDITIKAGITLSIREGTTVKFDGGKKLKINGTLVAEGTSSNKITFCSANTTPSPGDWYGLEIYGSGATANLENCIIKDAARGVRIYYSATADISNCEIKDNQYGIYVYKSHFDVEDCTIEDNTTRGIYMSRANDVSGSSSIVDNLIENNNYSGIYLYKSSVGSIRYNEIFDNDIGIDCSKSSPRLGYHGIKGWNNFNDNSTHFRAEYDCIPFLGNDICIDGHNQFTNLGSYNVYAESDCYVLAKANYWDDYSTSRFSAHDGSTIIYTDPLPDPLFQLSKLAVLADESSFNEAFAALNDSLDIDKLINEVYDPEWQSDRKFEFAVALNNLNFSEAAKNICIEIISSESDEIYKVAALNLLNDIYVKFLVNNDDKTAEFSSFCTTNQKILENPKLKNLSRLFITEIVSPLDLDEMDKIIAENKSNSIGARALQVKFVHYLEEENDLENATQVFEEIKKLYPGSSLEKSAAIELSGSSGGSFKKNNLEDLNQVPENFKLYGAYPNPFNPETKIMYNLPIEADVKIEIYNIIGQRVRVFEFDRLVPGNHQLTWYGVNEQNVQMPSGVYIFRFTADPKDISSDIYQTSIKVTLLK